MYLGAVEISLFVYLKESEVFVMIARFINRFIDKGNPDSKPPDIKKVLTSSLSLYSPAL